ncbi:molybdopterin-guanine dinucleotide biosynthesis protein B [Microbacterium sp. APC 3898]|uniref:Molybdopterin-guanine dinucleotide biosynthesis protein B n=2 Tax=Planococcus TaxID=1372 RepID=A0ABT7ZHC4_9BACL|nr:MULTISPECIES: molybdopterin-guanine dinucleotide biosynthesis protein B [Terrabacteria group]MBD8014269.1 molybdopterin-guanine dinucleotide biosynthesis protein B [Planococcus wigleyi]MDN3426539.1 molybdopterin-guanine dinucleotide biosynthesis protein B [Planococcus sp. APC 4016]MDN3500894.1 molybdopterin-guanine dinucleotide biosynthesis protein B [Microbacterium sp. APC 3898]
MAALKVLQVVGFKNSGKTTLALNLLEQAKNKGKTVAFIKHHGHGGPLELPKADTDSMRLLGSGADCSIAYGDGIIQMHQQKQTATVEELVDYASLGNPDLILVEGFKEAPFEKIVLLRSVEDSLELQKLQNIVLAIAPEELQLDNIRLILQNDSKLLQNWFANWMVIDNEGI